MMTAQQAQSAYQQTMRNVVADLERLGVEYKLTDRLGTLHTNAKVTRKKKNDFSPLKITDQILSSNPGDKIVFNGNGFPLNRLQSTITARANRILGSGRYTTTQDMKARTVILSVTGRMRPSIDEMMAALGGAGQ